MAHNPITRENSPDIAMSSAAMPVRSARVMSSGSRSSFTLPEITSPSITARSAGSDARAHRKAEITMIDALSHVIADDMADAPEQCLRHLLFARRIGAECNDVRTGADLVG